VTSSSTPAADVIDDVTDGTDDWVLRTEVETNRRRPVVSSHRHDLYRPTLVVFHLLLNARYSRHLHAQNPDEALTYTVSTKNTDGLLVAQVLYFLTAP